MPRRRSLPVETPFAGSIPATATSSSSNPSAAAAAAAAPTFAEHVRKRRKTIGERGEVSVRQSGIADWAAVQEAERQCQVFSGNERYSCFPTEGTSFVQGQWVSFVWNSRRPELLQDNRVNIYLYRGDSMSQVLKAEDQPNDPSKAGVYRVQVDDAWWGDNGPNYSEGVNTTLPFYFVITPSTRTPDGTQHTQSLFNAVQTTYPSSVLASMSSASLASLSSASAASASATASRSGTSPIATSTSGGTAGLSGNDGDSFPRWAIAVIVVLGFLAIAALCVLTFIILRRSRERRNNNHNRSSMGSSSPMMANVDTSGGHVGSPLLATAAMSPVSRQTHDDYDNQDSSNRAASMHDGASTISRAHSTTDGPFSGADAAIMADAFRKALRKPDFAGRPVEEGDSPQDEPKEELINRELAEEGRDIRSVASSRGVKVESPTATNEGPSHR